jgi:putative aminopeptidase FrvX
MKSKIQWSIGLMLVAFVTALIAGAAVQPVGKPVAAAALDLPMGFHTDSGTTKNSGHHPNSFASEGVKRTFPSEYAASYCRPTLPAQAWLCRFDATSFPADFAERAYGHVAYLAAGGARPVSSDGERRAFAYVRDQFQKMGLNIAVEEFDFESYEIDKMQLRLGGTNYLPSSVAFNPYAGVFNFEGQAILLDPQDLSSGRALPNIENNCVISIQRADFFRLMSMKPQLIVYVTPSEFNGLKAAGDHHFELKIDGHAARYKSANLVAEVIGSTVGSREIIVSAHLDAYRNSPGADDNATGIGVLIELARFFNAVKERLDARIKFVAFGAEELGVLGSSIYVTRHADELRNCILNFNIDSIGGPRGPFVQTLGGVAGIPARVGESMFPAALMNKAWEPLHSNWRLLEPRVLPAAQASNHPAWLKSLIENSANALGIKIIESSNSGSDDLSFTQAGVVATAVGYAGNVQHSPDDVVGQVHKENLATVGKLVACVIQNASTESAIRPSGSADVAGDPKSSFSGERIARIVADIAAGENSAQRRSSILRRLDELKVKYRLENFCSGSACGINVVVKSDGPLVQPLMLGAHYDRVSEGKGAVDNASGVAAVLELLAAFKNMPLENHALTAVFFDLEEVGMLGSKAYVSAREQRHALPELYMNFDVFGYGDTLWLMYLGDGLLSANAVRTAASRQNFALTMETHSPPGDDQVFREAGVEALGFSLVQQTELETIQRALRGEEVTARSPLMKIVHSQEDTPDKVNGNEVARALRVVETAIRALDTRR